MTRIERLLRESSQGTFAEAAARATLRVARAAAEAGLLDVAYVTADSPVGTLVLAATPRGVLCVSYRPEEVVLEEIARRVSPRVLREPKRLGEVRRELDEYFAGRRRAFDVAVDWSLAGSSPFRRRVLECTARLPYGTVVSYGDVAAAAGNRRAYRAAGSALGANPIPIVVPCHRVIRADGDLGEYAGERPRKEFLLTLESFRRS